MCMGTRDGDTFDELGLASTLETGPRLEDFPGVWMPGEAHFRHRTCCSGANTLAIAVLRTSWPFYPPDQESGTGVGHGNGCGERVRGRGTGAGNGCGARQRVRGTGAGPGNGCGAWAQLPAIEPDPGPRQQRRGAGCTERGGGCGGRSRGRVAPAASGIRAQLQSSWRRSI